MTEDAPEIDQPNDTDDLNNQEQSTELPKRQREVLDTAAIPKESLDKFEFFFSEYSLSHQIESCLEEALDQPSMNDESRRLLTEKYKQKKEFVVKFLKNEMFSIMTDLNLLEQSEFVVLRFKRAGASSQQNIGEHKYINIRFNSITRLLLSDIPTENQVDLMHSLAHEAYHVYESYHYSSTDKRTLEANKEGQNERYRSDRGEIGCELYSAKHLEQRALQIGETNEGLSEALKQRAQEIRSSVKERVK